MNRRHLLAGAGLLAVPGLAKVTATQTDSALALIDHELDTNRDFPTVIATVENTTDSQVEGEVEAVFKNGDNDVQDRVQNTERFPPGETTVEIQYALGDVNNREFMFGEIDVSDHSVSIRN